MKVEKFVRKSGRRLAVLSIAAALGATAAGVAAGAEAAANSPVAATAPAPSAAGATTRPSTVPAAVASPTDLVRRAPDPSSVVDAYTRAQTTDPGNPELEKAYVHRMVELNVPELADAQARDVVARGQLDGVAQAVTGYTAARRGQGGEAAQKLEVAVKLAPNDVFVMRTAAQVVAWFDTQKDRSQLDPRDAQAIAALRAAGADNAAYADAYRNALQLQRARQAYAAPTTMPATAPANPSVTTLSTFSEYGGPVYVEPPQTYAYNYPDPYADYPDPYDYYPWGWWGDGIIFGDFAFVHRDRFFDHDGRFHHDGRFDHGGQFDHNGQFDHDGRFAQDGGFNHDERPSQGRGDGGSSTFRPSSPPIRASAPPAGHSFGGGGGHFGGGFGGHGGGGAGRR